MVGFSKNQKFVLTKLATNASSKLPKFIKVGLVVRGKMNLVAKMKTGLY